MEKRYSLKYIKFYDSFDKKFFESVKSVKSVNPLVTRKDSFVRFCSKLEEMLIIVPNTTPLKDFFLNDK